MTPSPPGTPGASRSPRTVPLWVAVVAFAVVVVTSGSALFLAREAAEAQEAAEILADGVNRSRLPRDQAVALAEVARNRSEPLPHDATHSHDHGDSVMDHELTPEEVAAREEQLAAAIEAVARFDTLEKIEAAGYVKAANETDGVGEHWVKWSIVDRPFDPANPSMLLLDELEWGEGPELIAYSYWVASEEAPEGFVGEDDHWHRHLGICFDNGWLKDENLQREQCPGDWMNGSDLWMLHAWVVPGVENEYGIFHTANPLLCEHACGLEN